MSDQIVQLVKNQISTLSFTEKMELKVWLEEQIDKDRGAYVEEKKKDYNDKFDSLVNKSAEILQNSADSLTNKFKQAFGNTPEANNTGEKK